MHLRAVRLRRVVAGHEPAAPALDERCAVVHGDVPELRHDGAVRAHVIASHNEARHFERAGRDVTDEAALVSRVCRSRRLLIDGVEQHALFRVLRCDLDVARAGDVANDDRLVEEERARIVRAGYGTLDAGLREDAAAATPPGPNASSTARR